MIILYNENHIADQYFFYKFLFNFLFILNNSKLQSIVSVNERFESCFRIRYRLSCKIKSNFLPCGSVTQL